MSGHNKWSKIQHQKGRTDKARSSVFTKLLRTVTIAAQKGSDPNMNFSLRLAIDKAKSENVPKDNIERAIKRGSGEGKEGVVYEEGIYEGFGPGGVAILVETLTDNNNRTVSEMKHLFSKYGGTLGASGSVQWQFKRYGVVRISQEEKNKITDWESFELELMDAGVEDIKEQEEGVELITSVENLKKVLDYLKQKNLTPEDSGMEWVAKDTIELDNETGEKLDVLVEMLEECDDVNEVYTNAR